MYLAQQTMYLAQQTEKIIHKLDQNENKTKIITFCLGEKVHPCINPNPEGTFIFIHFFEALLIMIRSKLWIVLEVRVRKSVICLLYIA